MLQINIYTVHGTDTIETRSKIIKSLTDQEIGSLPSYEGKSSYYSLLSRYLAKKTVSEYTHCNIQDVEVLKDNMGKPYICKPQNARTSISISHSVPYIAIGLAKNLKLGIDIEVYKKIKMRDLLVAFHFEESEYLKRIKNPKAKLTSFYKIWTLKESYLKMKGTGFLTSNIPPIIKNRNIISRYKDEGRKPLYFYTRANVKFVFSACTNKKIEKNIDNYINLIPFKINSLSD